MTLYFSEMKKWQALTSACGASADRMRARLDAVPLRTSLRQGNGKNLCRIVIPPDLPSLTMGGAALISGLTFNCLDFEP